MWSAALNYLSCRWAGPVLLVWLMVAAIGGCWFAPVFATETTVPAQLPPHDGGKTPPGPESSALAAEKLLNVLSGGWRCGIGPAEQSVFLPAYAVEGMAPPVDIDALRMTLRARPELAMSSDHLPPSTFRLADVAIVPGQEAAVLAYLQQHYRDIAHVIPLAKAQMDDPRNSNAGIEANDFGRDPRQPAYFVLQDGSWLQQQLVGRGMAMVAPGMDADKPVAFDVVDASYNGPAMAAAQSDPMPEGMQKTVSRQAVIMALMVAEENARTAQRGMWGQTGQDGNKQNGGGQNAARTTARYYFAAYVTADRPGEETPFAADGIGSFAVVSGVLRSVEIQKYRAYLNFGKDWRKDFTIALDQDQMAEISASGFGLAGWVGRRVLVRGMIENRGGPYIAPLNLASLCVAKQ
ncbi:hypothetical protein LF95_14495 [Thalassospira sp. TSL5-1]|nr:hypothetical protein LF95_14495 [Thalassospira sp. TSL5-1]